MINQIHLIKDMININESDFYTGVIKPVLHEDVAVVYTDLRLRKLYKYKPYAFRITRPRGIQYALRYLYEGINSSNKMRNDISIPVLNDVIRIIENKLNTLKRQ